MNWNRPLIRPENTLLGKILRPVTPTHTAASVILGVWIGTTVVMREPLAIYEIPLQYAAALLVMGAFVYIPSAIYYSLLGITEVPDRPTKGGDVDDVGLAPPIYPRVWYTIAFRWMGVLGLGASAVFFVATPASTNQLGTLVELASYVFFVFGGALFALSLLAPLAVLRDREVLVDSDPWRPSRWYYLMVFPTGLAGLILSAVYTRKRLKHYGIQSAARIGRTRVLPESDGDS